MTAYKSTKRTNLDPARKTEGECSFYGEVTLSAAAADDDTLEFFDVPKGFVVHGAEISSTDLDTGANSIALDVGISGDTNKIFADSAVAQAGTFSNAMNKDAHLYEFTAKSTVYATVKTVGTGATGTVKLSLHGTFSKN